MPAVMSQAIVSICLVVAELHTIEQKLNAIKDLLQISINTLLSGTILFC